MKTYSLIEKCKSISGLQSVLRTFRLDTSANMGVITAILIVPVLAGVGAVVDMGRTVSVKNHMQDQLDNAVLAAKESRLKPNQQIVVAKEFYRSNYGDDANFTDPVFYVEGDVFHGTSSAVLDTKFMKIVGRETVDVNVKSAATGALSRGPICFMAMHPTRAHTLELVGTVSVLAPDCNIYGNSSHEDDVVDPHNEENFLTGKSVQAIGYGHHYIENVSPPLEYAPELIADPLSSMMIPSAGSCITLGELRPHGRNNIYPGTYCDGLEIEDIDKVDFKPGTYVISGGDFEVSNSKIKAKGVTIVLKDGAEISWEESKIEIQAPKSGTYAGIAIMGDRVESSHEMEDSEIDIHGVVYLPLAEFGWYNLGHKMPKAKWTAWIIDGVTWGGSGTINIRFDLANSDIPYPSALLHVIPRDENIRLVY